MKQYFVAFTAPAHRVTPAWAVGYYGGLIAAGNRLGGGLGVIAVTPDDTVGAIGIQTELAKRYSEEFSPYDTEASGVYLNGLLEVNKAAAAIEKGIEERKLNELGKSVTGVKFYTSSGEQLWSHQLNPDEVTGCRVPAGLVSMFLVTSDKRDFEAMKRSQETGTWDGSMCLFAGEDGGPVYGHDDKGIIRVSFPIEALLDMDLVELERGKWCMHPGAVSIDKCVVRTHVYEEEPRIKKRRMAGIPQTAPVGLGEAPVTQFAPGLTGLGDAPIAFGAATRTANVDLATANMAQAPMGEVAGIREQGAPTEATNWVWENPLATTAAQRAPF